MYKLLALVILSVLSVSEVAFAKEAAVDSKWTSPKGEFFRAIHKNTEDDQCLNIEAHLKGQAKSKPELKRICAFSEGKLHHQLGPDSVQDVTFGQFSWTESVLNFDFSWVSTGVGAEEVHFKCQWDAAKNEKEFHCAEISK